VPIDQILAAGDEVENRVQLRESLTGAVPVVAILAAAARQVYGVQGDAPMEANSIDQVCPRRLRGARSAARTDARNEDAPLGRSLAIGSAV